MSVMLLLLSKQADGSHVCTNTIVVGDELVTDAVTREGDAAAAGPGWIRDEGGAWHAPKSEGVDNEAQGQTPAATGAGDAGNG